MNENIIKFINETLSKIYKEKQYPSESDFLISKEKIEEIVNCLQNKGLNPFLLNCNDCIYNYTIIINSTSEIKDNFFKNPKGRKKWIKKNKDKASIIYLSISKLGPFAMFYETNYFHFLLEFSSVIYDIKDIRIINKITEVMESHKIYLLKEDILNLRFNFKFKGKIIGYNAHPKVQTLLFAEELH